jgi:hypothetical protein
MIIMYTRTKKVRKLLKPLHKSVRRLLPLVASYFLLFLLVTASASAQNLYSRSDFNYQSYKPNATIGFYTGQTCSAIDIDHVVSLKDAYDTGGASWSLSKKQSFANDKASHVPSCASINRSKGASTPSEFLRKSNDGKGLEYEIVTFCEYVGIYHSVKLKYGLSFDGNNRDTFKSCDITI